MVAITGESDGNFGSAVTTDFATVVYRELAPSAALDLVSDGVRVRFSIVPGDNYQLERALKLKGPWTVISTSRGLASGLIEYLDTSARRETAFYRTVVGR